MVAPHPMRAGHRSRPLAADGVPVGYRCLDQGPSVRGHGMEAVVMNDVAVFDHINALSAEEEELFA